MEFVPPPAYPAPPPPPTVKAADSRDDSVADDGGHDDGGHATTQRVPTSDATPSASTGTGGASLRVAAESSASSNRDSSDSLSSSSEPEELTEYDDVWVTSVPPWHGSLRRQPLVVLGNDAVHAPGMVAWPNQLWPAVDDPDATTTTATATGTPSRPTEPETPPSSSTPTPTSPRDLEARRASLMAELVRGTRAQRYEGSPLRYGNLTIPSVYVRLSPNRRMLYCERLEWSATVGTLRRLVQPRTPHSLLRSTPAFIALQLRDIDTIIKGTSGKGFSSYHSPNQYCVSIGYGHIRALDLIFESERDWDLWVNGLIYLVRLYQHESEEDAFWRSSWPLPVDAPLDAKGVRDLLRHLNMKASKSYVAQCIKEIDRNGDQAMDFGEFVDLTARLLSLSTEEIRTFYSRYNVHSNRDGESGMELSGFQHFLLYEQKEQQSLAEISMLLQPLLAPGEQHLSRSAFERFLLSEGNTVFDPKCDQVYHDMTQPLCNYYIYSSHNTYLEGHQLNGVSSVEMYKSVLLWGCRCVELDCWDGSHHQPIIYHGGTITSKLRFRDVCVAIREYGFVRSTYPVILSLEIHCSEVQQRVMVDIMTQVFGDLLPEGPLCAPGHRPSPHELQHKILLKADLEAIQDETLRSMVYLPIVSRGCISLDQPLESRECWAVNNVNEPNIRTKDPQRAATFVSINQRMLTRVYPFGTRFTSSNFHPNDSWNVGCQLVSLNLQTPGRPVYHNEGKFLDNGGVGYLLKPPLYAALPRPDDFERPVKLTVQVYCAQLLPKNRRTMGCVDPFVMFNILGIPQDYAEVKTKVVHNNGLNPRWNQVFEFTIHSRRQAVFLAMIYDTDILASVSGRTKLAYYSLPVSCIRSGYRVLPMRDPSRTGLKIIPLCKLVCRFELSELDLLSRR